MRKKIFTILAGFVFALTVKASDVKYPVSEIPEELKKDVKAVVREDITIFKILTQSKATVYAYMAVTIFNENGEGFAHFSEDYDKLTKITTLNGSVYDAAGKLIRKLKSSDINDHSLYDGSTLFSDDRIKSSNLAQTTYPYTVVFEYEKEYKYLYHIDGSYFIPDEKVAVQKSSYQLIYPVSLSPRYKTFNVNVEPKKEILENGFESVSWTLTDLKPIKTEPLSKENIFPRVMAAPTVFEYDGYIGNMSTWEDYGKWQLALNKGRDVLPDATKQKVKELTKDLKTVEEKTRVLYEYMQNKTRYVNIAEGIGGLQPFDAEVVDKNGYGDCKALSNYTIALLKEAGVEAFYCKIYGGYSPPKFILDFPSHQTNHIVAAVPNGVDTIWLECTSQSNPFNYQGGFTGDRIAFLVSEKGSRLVKTHRYSAEQNVQTRLADVVLNPEGNAKAKIKTTYNGLQYETGGLDEILGNQYDKQQKWVQNNTDIPSFDINSIFITSRKEKIPSAIVTVDLTLNRLATVSGKRLFLTANLMNRSTYMPEKVENRKTKVFRGLAYIDLDTIRYHLPEELYPEFLPEPTKLSSRFGEYETKFSIEQGNLIYIRRVKMNKGEFPPESYQELITFYKSINKADNVKIVFLNKT